MKTSKRLTEVQVVVLNLEDGADSLEAVMSAESVGELIEQGLKVCREYEAFQLVASPAERSPSLMMLLQQVKQMREEFRRAGVLVDISTDQDDREEDQQEI